MEFVVLFLFCAAVGLIIFAAIRLSSWLESKSLCVTSSTETDQSEPMIAEQPSTPATNQTGAEILENFLHQNGCIIEHSEEKDIWQVYNFHYQGGYFEAYAHNQRDEIILYYSPITLDYSPENLKWIQYICHKMTVQSLHVKVTHDYNYQDDKFIMNFQVGGGGAREEVIEYYLSLLFGAANQLKVEYKERDNRTYDNLVEGLRERELFLRCQQYNEPMRIMANYKHLNANHLTLAQTIASLFSQEQVEDMLSMTVVTEQGTEQITQRDKIASFDLFSAIVNTQTQPIQASNAPVAITLDTTFFHYTFTLHLVEQTMDNVFIRLTAMKVPYDHLQKQMPDIVYSPESVSCLLCYETSKEHSFEAFGKQIAAARKADREGAELTDEQEQLLSMAEGKLDYQLLEGRRLANHGQYLQAIALLEPAYRSLTQKDNKVVDFRSMAIDAAYRLGYCYYHLKLWDKAYYYFSIAYKADRLDASYMYYQLMYQTHDVTLLPELTEEKNKMEKTLQEMAKRREQFDEDEEQQYYKVRDYYLFLYKLHAEIMIRSELYDYAYNDLNYLLQYEQTQEYAQARIDELDQIHPTEE